MTSTSSVLVFCVWAALVLSPVKAMAVKQTCPDDQFWDFGTDRCERCNTICDNADKTGFSDFCREMCPAYANAVLGLAPETGHDDDKEDGLPVGVKVGIAVGACALTVGLVVAAVLYKRRPRVQKPFPVPVEDDHSSQGNQETQAGFNGTSSFAPTLNDLTGLQTLLGGRRHGDGEMTETRI